MPSVKQQADNAAVSASVTVELASTPTVGNLLVATCYVARNQVTLLTPPEGFEFVDENNTPSDFVLSFYARIVQEGDGKSFTFAFTEAASVTVDLEEIEPTSGKYSTVPGAITLAKKNTVGTAAASVATETFPADDDGLMLAAVTLRGNVTGGSVSEGWTLKAARPRLLTATRTAAEPGNFSATFSWTSSAIWTSGILLITEPRVPTPEYRSVGTGSAATGAATPAVPADAQVGDLLLMFGESAGPTAGTAATNELTATGWTKVESKQQGNTRATILWRIATGGDPVTTNDTGDHQQVRIAAFRAGTFNPSSPIHVIGAGGQASTKAGSVPGATTTRDRVLVVAQITGHLPDAATSTEFSGWTNASLIGLTEIHDATVTAGDGGAHGIAVGTKITAGAYSATTVTAVTEAERACISLGLEPPASGQKVTLTAATTTNAAVAITEKKRVTATAATTANTAQAITKRKLVALTPSTMTNAAVALTLRKRVSLTPGAESDAAVALVYELLGGLIEKTLTPASEADAAVALVYSKLIHKALTPATETDTAQALTDRKRVGLAPAAETDAATALTLLHRRSLAPAAEQTVAVALALTRFLALSAATETDSALALALTHHVALSAAQEADSGVDLKLVGAFLLSLTPAVETDTAVRLRLAGFEPLVVAAMVRGEGVGRVREGYDGSMPIEREQSGIVR